MASGTGAVLVRMQQRALQADQLINVLKNQLETLKNAAGEWPERLMSFYFKECLT